MSHRTVTTYVLDNASEQAATRFASLEACYDPVTTRQLEEIGVSLGWSCLEVGGGGGSIARWLAERVGSGGRVIVTDIDALKPGGWALIEDFDCSWTAVEPDGEPTDAALFAKVLNAFYVVLRQAGVDLAYGRRFHSLLRGQGLVEVHVEAHIHVANGGSPGFALYRANIEQVRARLTGLGLVTDREVDRFCDLLEDPDFSCSHQPMVSGRGRRPLR